MKEYSFFDYNRDYLDKHLLLKENIFYLNIFDLSASIEELMGNMLESHYKNYECLFYFYHLFENWH